MAPRVHVRLSAAPLSTGDALRFVADPACGAEVLFTGTVRDQAEGRAVEGLDYEAYEERATAQLDELAAQLVQKWPEVRAVWMEHRVGSLAIGEHAVVVAVSAPHRGAAFEAARWGIDTLKATVAIWKRERWTGGGAHWPGTPGGSPQDG